MKVNDMVSYYLCDECIIRDNSLFNDCFMCVKKERTGKIFSQESATKALGFEENHPELRGKRVFHVYDFETGNTPSILEDDLQPLKKATQNA